MYYFLQLHVSVQFSENKKIDLKKFKRWKHSHGNKYGSLSVTTWALELWHHNGQRAWLLESTGLLQVLQCSAKHCRHSWFSVPRSDEQRMFSSIKKRRDGHSRPQSIRYSSNTLLSGIEADWQSREVFSSVFSKIYELILNFRAGFMKSYSCSWSFILLSMREQALHSGEDSFPGFMGENKPPVGLWNPALLMKEFLWSVQLGCRPYPGQSPARA